jgi:Cd2+/Zn2+-exporting ATPase
MSGSHDTHDEHEHGPGCGHDHHGHDKHGHDKHDHGKHEHQHGPGCGHDHEHGHHDHAHDHGHEHHEHHEGCDHDHEDGHHPHDAAIAAQAERPCLKPGAACQYDLGQAIPGERDEVGRFRQLELLLEAQRGITDAHFRDDAGRPEVCIHYEPERISLNQVIALVKTQGLAVSDRYKEQAWLVRGMDSAQCAFVIEHALRRVPGVLSASVAYAAERLVVEYDRQRISPAQIEKKVDAFGYRLEIPEKGHVCSHHAGPGGLAPKLEMPLVVTSGVLLAGGWLAETFVPGLPPIALTIVYALAMLTGGAFALRGTINSLRQLRGDIESLMVIAAIGAAILGAWFEGGFLLFLFSLGHALEHRAMERARRSVEALARLRPTMARVRKGAEVVELPVETIKRGDVVLVRPGDRVPLDGVIKEGRSALDQSAVTGESIPVAKGPGDPVFAATINSEAALEIEVTRLSGNSVLARVIDMVSKAEAQKGPAQLFAKNLERRAVPVILGLAVAVPFVLLALGFSPKESVLRAVSMLVGASPCALAISTPAAVLSAVAAAARAGVLVKGGAHLEGLGSIRSMAFDKTGTLTIGKPKLIGMSAADGVTREQLLSTAAAVEALCGHPLAKAVVAGTKELGIAPEPGASGMEAVHGRGIHATLGASRVSIGSVSLFDPPPPEAIRAEVDRLERAGQSTMVVKRDERWLGVIGVADTLRHNARATLAGLKAIGIARTVMLTGDNQRVAKAIGEEVGIDEARGALMPEGKVESLRELSKDGGVAMVGDGVNDAPALAAATVGVAMGGAGQDVALETADIVLMSDDLAKLPFTLGLARKASGVIRQNLVVALGVSAILIVASVFGLTRISQAVLLHEGSTLLVVANGLRLLRYS